MLRGKWQADYETETMYVPRPVSFRKPCCRFTTAEMEKAHRGGPFHAGSYRWELCSAAMLGVPVGVPPAGVLLPLSRTPAIVVVIVVLVVALVAIFVAHRALAAVAGSRGRCRDRALGHALADDRARGAADAGAPFAQAGFRTVETQQDLAGRNRVIAGRLA